MKRTASKNAKATDPLTALDEVLAGAARSPQRLADARRELVQFAESAREVSRPDVASCAGLLAALLEIAGCLRDQDASAHDSEVSALLEFARSGVAALRAGIEEAPEATTLQSVEEEARKRWGDYLGLLDQQVASGGIGQGQSWDTELTAQAGNESAASAAGRAIDFVEEAKRLAAGNVNPQLIVAVLLEDLSSTLSYGATAKGQPAGASR